METSIAVFRGKEVRRKLHNNEWWFVIADVVSVLTDSIDPNGYIKDMRRRDEELSKGWGQIATTLLVETQGGPQKMNCADTEGIFRIIQSIPSPKAEPFKRWLAKVGYERVQEIEDPEPGIQNNSLPSSSTNWAANIPEIWPRELRCLKQGMNCRLGW